MLLSSQYRSASRQRLVPSMIHPSSDGSGLEGTSISI